MHSRTVRSFHKEQKSKMTVTAQLVQQAVTYNGSTLPMAPMCIGAAQYPVHVSALYRTDSFRVVVRRYLQVTRRPPTFRVPRSAARPPPPAPPTPRRPPPSANLPRSAVCRPPPSARRPPPAIHFAPPTARCPPSAACRPPTFRVPPPAFRGRPSCLVIVTACRLVTRGAGPAIWPASIGPWTEDEAFYVSSVVCWLNSRISRISCSSRRPIDWLSWNGGARMRLPAMLNRPGQLAFLLARYDSSLLYEVPVTVHY